MALTLLRHAALGKKHQNRYNGWTNLSINPTLFEAHKVALLQIQKFDIVYSSDLIRCTQTLEMMGITNYRTDKRLREVRFKDKIEGLNFNEIEKLSDYKSSYIETKEAWHTYICAESQIDFEKRIQSFLAELPKDKEILICSHAGTLQKIMLFLGYAKHKIAYLEHIRIDNVI